MQSKMLLFNVNCTRKHLTSCLSVWRSRQCNLATCHIKGKHGTFSSGYETVYNFIGVFSIAIVCFYSDDHAALFKKISIMDATSTER